MTRAVYAACRGDFVASFRHHPLAMFIVPLVVVVMTRNAIGFVRDGRWGEGEASQHPLVTWGAAVLLAALIALWIARFFGALGGPEPV